MYSNIQNNNIDLIQKLGQEQDVAKQNTQLEDLLRMQEQGKKSNPNNPQYIIDRNTRAKNVYNNIQSILPQEQFKRLANNSLYLLRYNITFESSFDFITQNADAQNIIEFLKKEDLIHEIGLGILPKTKLYDFWEKNGTEGNMPNKADMVAQIILHRMPEDIDTLLNAGFKTNVIILDEILSRYMPLKAKSQPLDQYIPLTFSLFSDQEMN